jgi:hypothetical protein
MRVQAIDSNIKAGTNVGSLACIKHDLLKIEVLALPAVSILISPYV